MWKYVIINSGYYYSIENADATPLHLEVILRLVRSDGVQVLCRSLHLGCSVDSCELYLYTCIERRQAKGLHFRKQHGNKREQPRCELRSALHVLRFLFRWEALIVLCSSLHCGCVILIPVGSNLDAFWTLFGHLLDAFWTLCGCLLDPGTFQEPILTFFWFLTISGTFFLTPFRYFWRHFSDMLFAVFLASHFSNIFSFRVNFGSSLGAFLGSWEPWK